MNNEENAADIFTRSNYDISDLDSEIKADQLCAALLKDYHQHLLAELKLEPLDAGALAAGADYFLREFLIGARQENIFDCVSERVRQFGGHWYIIRNLEPNMAELTAMLSGTAGFYQYCFEKQLTDADTAEAITQTCSDLAYFHQRIEDFHAIIGDGFSAWEQACPL